MKTSLAVLSAALFFATPAASLAQNSHAQHMTPAAAKPSAMPVMTRGVVKKVDTGQSLVTIAHDDIKNLDMPKMTMAFKVKDPAWLKKMKDGDRISFAADMVGGELTVVAYEIVR